VSAVEAISYGLLALGVAAQLIATLGVAASRDTYERIHYLAPSALAAILIVAAIWVRAGPSIIALQATALLVFVLATSPALAHAIARSARIRELGDWRLRPGEGIEVEER
jgi:multisubunit Na+/H+ antiporter MnhG subunit